MKFLTILAASVLVLSAQLCSGRPEGSWKTTISPLVDLATTTEYNSFESQARKTSVVATLKNISATLNVGIGDLIEQVSQKTMELKDAVGERAAILKENLRTLKGRLHKALDDLTAKVSQLFQPAQYASFGNNAVEALIKVFNLKQRIDDFVGQVKNATGKKWEDAKQVLKELRNEIHEKIQEFLHGPNKEAALYRTDDDDEFENDAYVIETLKDISRTLKEKVITLGEHIHDKLQELKTATGEQARLINDQLVRMRQNLAKSRQQLVEKLRLLLKPAHYGSFGGRALEVFSDLSRLFEKLQALFRRLENVTASEWERLKRMIYEVREDLELEVRALMQGSGTPAALYQAEDDSDDHEGYVIANLKEMAGILKNKLIVYGQQLEKRLHELKQATGEHLAQIKESVNEIYRNIKESRALLKEKINRIFTPAQYSALSDRAMEMVTRMFALRWRLEYLTKELENVDTKSDEEREEILKLIDYLNKEIRYQVMVFLNGSSSAPAGAPATYQGSDIEDDDYRAYIIATLKDIRSTIFKQQFAELSDKIKQTLVAIKTAAGERAELLKSQLQALRDQLDNAGKELLKKIYALFKPARYASLREHTTEVLEKVKKIRDKLYALVEQTKTVTVEKMNKLKVLIKELRDELKEKIHELLNGPRENNGALYLASDDDEDNDAYVIDTLRSMGRTLKEQFLDVGRKLAEKLRLAKTAVGEHLDDINTEINELRAQLGESRRVLAEKLRDLILPAQYDVPCDRVSAVKEKLSAIREKMRALLRDVNKISDVSSISDIKRLGSETWAKVEQAIRELRHEIKQTALELLRGTTTPAPA